MGHLRQLMQFASVQESARNIGGLKGSPLGWRMRRQVARGCVLQLTLPMPAELRQHDHGDSAYEVFGIVRRVEPVIGSIVDAGSQVEVDFLGRRPPVGYLSKPWAIFNITSSPDHNS